MHHKLKHIRHGLKELFYRHHVYYHGPIDRYFDGKKFHNPGKPNSKNFFDLLKWRFTSKKGEWPNYIDNLHNNKPPIRVEGNELLAHFVGHVTFLLQTSGLNILTDPVWSERASPFKNLGPKRINKPGIEFDNLPKIDIVLISHNHYDHLDLSTIQRLWHRDQPRIITPLGNDRIIHNFDPSIRVESYNIHHMIDITHQVQIILEPMHHWSARGLFDRNRALWAAFVIKTSSGNIYFIGDSGYGNGDYFRESINKYQKFRLAMLPIGAYKPRWFMQYSHMNPEEAILAYKDLNEPYTIPSHYGTFPLADEGYFEQQQDLIDAINKHKINSERFKILQIGQSWLVPE